MYIYVYCIPVYLFICLSIYLAISYPWSLEVASCDTIEELKNHQVVKTARTNQSIDHNNNNNNNKKNKNKAKMIFDPSFGAIGKQHFLPWISKKVTEIVFPARSWPIRFQQALKVCVLPVPVWP